MELRFVAQPEKMGQRMDYVAKMLEDRLVIGQVRNVKSCLQ